MTFYFKRLGMVGFLYRVGWDSAALSLTEREREREA